MRQKELFKLKVHRYRTPKGHPTCAIDFEKGDVCQFISFIKLGTVEVCSAKNSLIMRQDGDGYLVPTEMCPIWNGKK